MAGREDERDSARPRAALARALGQRGLLLLAAILCAVFCALELRLALRKASPPLGAAFWTDQAWRFVLIGAPAFLLAFHQARGWGRVLVLVLVCALVCIPSAAQWGFVSQPDLLSHGGEVPVPEAHRLGDWLVALTILSPIVLVALWHWALLLDRYLLRKFLTPFLLCLSAFTAIWLIFDLNDNLPDFREGRISLGRILSFYAWQVPLIFNLIAPPALLVGLVFSLSRLSRSNEIVSMLSSGHGLWRTLLPLFLVGGYVSLLCLVCQYEAAPWAEGKAKSLLNEFSGDQKSVLAERQLFLKKEARRLWYIGQIPFRMEEERLRVIDIFQFDQMGGIEWQLSAEEAYWDPKARAWHFYQASILRHAPPKAPERSQKNDYVISQWSETPWELTSGRLEADYLGVPQLLSYLRTRERDSQSAPPRFLTNLHERFASPWICLAIVFVAAPLGIAFSRRGTGGSVATAIVLFGVLLFLTRLSLSLGKAGFLGPATAAWLTNGVFLAVGLTLLYFRSRHRSFRLAWPKWRRS